MSARTTPSLRLGVALLVAAALAGCATPAADRAAVPSPAQARAAVLDVAGAAAGVWQSPWPGEAVGAAAGTQDGTEPVPWWARSPDPLLARLVQSAQAVSADVSAAGARIAQAQAARAAATAPTLGPSLDVVGGVQRGFGPSSPSIVSQASLGLQTRWELDLFGGLRAGRTAAEARLAGSQAAARDARLAVAAEVAAGYVELRGCEAQRALALEDAGSREEVARLTGLVAEAGLRAPADAALARASAAQGRAAAAQQAQRCDALQLSLAALTGWSPQALREATGAATAVLPALDLAVPQALPATLLQRRPDLARAAAEVQAAAADIAQRRAERRPQLSLSGSIAPGVLRAGDLKVEAVSWQLGPLSLTVPLVDGGARAAAEDAARAAYDDALVQLQAALRGAVREVEEALLGLQGTAARRPDAEAAVAGFDASLRATEARFRAGAASLFELEDARRSAVAARAARADLERERLQAVVALHRALGAPDADRALGAAGADQGVPAAGADQGVPAAGADRVLPASSVPPPASRADR